MKIRENNKRLIIVVSTLLLVIGVSLAYFISNILINGEGASTNGTTSMIKDTTIDIEGTLEFNDLDIYPGYKNISKIKLTATGNEELVTYDLIWEGINTINTPLKYYVYKTTTSEEVSITCEKESERVGTSTIHYESCTNNNFENIGEVIASGEIAQTETKKEYNLKAGEMIKGTEEGNIIYYYVVLEYPNLEESQNIDMGGKFEGKVTVKIGEEIKSDITIAKIYKSTENGYEQIKELPEGYAINKEKSTCTNSAIPRIKNNKLLITNLITSGTECSIYLDRDTEKPTITEITTEVTTEVTETTITVNVTATDNVGITEYWYGIDNEEFIKSENNTYTFTGLSPESDYTVKVYVKDNAGNQSDTTTKSVQTTQTFDSILAGITVKSETPDFSNIAESDEGVYKVNDPVYGGESYYYRGAVTNNYVKFGGFCWRIIRINGDGSIRLIYDGSSCHANGTSTVESIAVTGQKYNTSSNNNSYVGWTYKLGSQRTLIGAPSNAKTQLEKWYNSNLASQASKIADGKYCNDRDVVSGTWSDTGGFNYAGLTRKESNSPSLACNSGDVYTLKVGLITSDEVIYAGGIANNKSYYLYNGQVCSTMSPSYAAVVFCVDSHGSLNNYGYVDSPGNFRPVINLKADTEFQIGGNGTLNNPYVVQ